MKISKSKQELARIISENGGWRDAEFAAQDSNGSVTTFSDKPYRQGIMWESRNAELEGFIVKQKISNWHQTVLSRAEYSHLYPEPDADGWIEWKGGECPVDEGTLIDVRYRDGHEQVGCECGVWRSELYGTHYWLNSGGKSNIIAYRLHKPGKAKQEFCESVVRSIPEPETKPSIEQLAADYRNAKDYAGRKQQEADDAKADADEKLRVLEIAGEALGLLVSPVTTKQDPELLISDWRDLIDGDVICVDSVEASEDIRDALQGVESVVVTDLHMTGCVTNENYPAGESWWLGGPAETKWRFIRRP